MYTCKVQIVRFGFPGLTEVGPARLTLVVSDNANFAVGDQGIALSRVEKNFGDREMTWVSKEFSF